MINREHPPEFRPLRLREYVQATLSILKLKNEIARRLLGEPEH